LRHSNSDGEYVVTCMSAILMHPSAELLIRMKGL
jgi:hypothetical protein